VVVVPVLAGLTGKGVRALTWASACGAVVGCALLGGGSGAGSGFGVGDLLSVASAVFFGVQVPPGLFRRALPCLFRRVCT
jgi:drug/metabolite transporter (DMT)-like permease